MAEFKEGDIVQLKSGGPRMTVDAPDGFANVSCHWFAGSKLEKARFSPGTLKHVTDEKPAKGK